MKQMQLGLNWNIDGHHMEVTKIFKNGKVQITETWVSEDTWEDCKHAANYGVGTDDNGNEYAYAVDYPEYKLYAIGADNWTEDKEDKDMANTQAKVQIVEITVDGVKYTQTRPGYYYRKQADEQKRISKAEWEKVRSVWEAEQKTTVEEKAQEEAKAQAKKSKKTYKSKDVAFEMDTLYGHVTLTSKQVDFIKHIPDTCFYENGLDSCPWCDVLADEIGGQFAGKPFTTGAMISTIREKGLIAVNEAKVNGKNSKFFTFTELGKVIAEKLGLE